MTTTSQTDSSNPIKDIETVELELNKKIEASKSRFATELYDLGQEFKEKNKEFGDNLREQGMKKLDNVKKEASELLKTRMSTAETAIKKTMEEAGQKKKFAIDAVVKLFKDNIKA